MFFYSGFHQRSQNRKNINSGSGNYLGYGKHIRTYGDYDVGGMGVTKARKTQEKYKKSRLISIVSKPIKIVCCGCSYLC